MPFASKRSDVLVGGNHVTTLLSDEKTLSYAVKDSSAGKYSGLESAISCIHSLSVDAVSLYRDS